jgi:AbrB family looped-hinge helix DNA binding protein
MESLVSKVTSKYQVTLPKKIAETYSIRPGDDIEWVPAGETMLVTRILAYQTPGIDKWIDRKET